MNVKKKKNLTWLLIVYRTIYIDSYFLLTQWLHLVKCCHETIIWKTPDSWMLVVLCIIHNSRRVTPSLGERICLSKLERRRHHFLVFFGCLFVLPIRYFCCFWVKILLLNSWCNALLILQWENQDKIVGLNSVFLFYKGMFVQRSRTILQDVLTNSQQFSNLESLVLLLICV